VDNVAQFWSGITSFVGQVWIGINSLGYYRGFVSLLDEVQAQQPAAQPWCDQLRALARAYRFDAVLAQLAATPETP